ncbi:hypothetical protein C8R43DRAFT_862269, partial [Mycena crocata]
MKAFIKALLGWDPGADDSEGGIFGKVKAYYGTVEAQGRGSLHCHMMVWCTGSLNPNEIKAKALAEDGGVDFQKRLIAFMEDTISTSVPPPSEHKPELQTPLSKAHPCATRGPGPDIPPDDAADARVNDLHRLAERCQRHRHTGTCYKYWRGYPELKDCRFDLDASNFIPISVFDPDTGEFTLRCLDGLVNNFNETILQAIRCNMDIKFIGSGPAAKAVLYYITDYITKSQLQAHVAYAALELAVNRLGEYDPESDDLTSRAKTLLQKCAHSMISKQELSGQQVVSYLLDFEDHFTSHQYMRLYWTSLEAHIDKEQPSPECYPPKAEPVSASADTEPALDDAQAEEEVVEPSADDPEPGIEDGILEADLIDDSDLITLAVDRSGKLIPTANQACDYQERGDLLADV